MHRHCLCYSVSCFTLNFSQWAHILQNETHVFWGNIRQAAAQFLTDFYDFFFFPVCCSLESRKIKKLLPIFYTQSTQRLYQVAKIWLKEKTFFCGFLYLRVESMNATLHLCRQGALLKLQLTRVHHGTVKNIQAPSYILLIKASHNLKKHTHNSPKDGKTLCPYILAPMLDSCYQVWYKLVNGALVLDWARHTLGNLHFVTLTVDNISPNSYTSQWFTILQ